MIDGNNTDPTTNILITQSSVDFSITFHSIIILKGTYWEPLSLFIYVKTVLFQT